MKELVSARFDLGPIDVHGLHGVQKLLRLIRVLRSFSYKNL
jgi:hypothetical protein